MNHPTFNAQKTNRLAHLSLLSIIATIIFASIHYFYELGYHALIAGAAIIILFPIMRAVYRYTRSRLIPVLYGLLNIIIIIYAGLFDGFWNHLFKIFIYHLHNGYIPPLLSHLFKSPSIGNPGYELTGVLTFTASMFAAYYGYRFLKSKYQDKQEINS